TLCWDNLPSTLPPATATAVFKTTPILRRPLPVRFAGCDPKEPVSWRVAPWRPWLRIRREICTIPTFLITAYSDTTNPLRMTPSQTMYGGRRISLMGTAMRGDRMAPRTSPACAFLLLRGMGVPSLVSRLIPQATCGSLTPRITVYYAFPIILPQVSLPGMPTLYWANRILQALCLAGV